MRDKNDMHLSRVREKIVGACLGSSLKIAWTSLCSQHEPRSRMGPHLVSALLYSKPMIPMLEEEKDTLKWNRINSGFTLRASTPAT